MQVVRQGMGMKKWWANSDARSTSACMAPFALWRSKGMMYCL